MNGIEPRKLTGEADQLNADIKNLAEQAKQIIWQQASGGSQDHNLVYGADRFCLGLFCWLLCGLAGNARAALAADGGNECRVIGYYL